MTEERLAEIEARHQKEGCAISALAGFGQWYGECPGADWCPEVALLAEVRCLKREVHLLSLSRGTPSVVGRD